MCALVAAGVLAGGARAAVPTRVTVITDSVGGLLQWSESGRAVLARGIDVDVQARVCRRLVEPGCHTVEAPPPSVLETIDALGPAIGKTVVIDVGYNDESPSYAADLDRIMAALAASGVAHVVWVTLEETEGVWAQSNAAIRAAPARWPQLTVADWAPVASGQPWFVDDAHLTVAGGVALAQFLRPFVLKACGEGCAMFCGLVRTVNGFDAVEAAGADCPPARAAIAGAERGAPGGWVCSRAVGGSVELDCLEDGMHARVLERAPVAPVRRDAVVTLGGWSFRLAGERIMGREGTRGWMPLARSPFCIPAVPREVLVALRLHPRTRNGGCFTG